MKRILTTSAIDPLPAQDAASIFGTPKERLDFYRREIHHESSLLAASLRPRSDSATSVLSGNDDDETTIHLGLFNEEKLIAITSLFKVNSTEFKEPKQYQLRGMAVLEEFRKYGLGTLLINEAEKICIEKNTEVLWFNARESAVPFYLKLNYKTFGTKFEINGIGPHYKMYKTF